MKNIIVIAVVSVVLALSTACMPDITVPEIEIPAIPEEPQQPAPEPEENVRSIADLAGCSFIVEGRSDIPLKTGELLEEFRVASEGNSIEAYGKKYPVDENGVLDTKTGNCYMVTVTDEDAVMLISTDNADEKYTFRRKP